MVQKASGIFTIGPLGRDFPMNYKYPSQAWYGFLCAESAAKPQPTFPFGPLTENAAN